MYLFADNFFRLLSRSIFSPYNWILSRAVVNGGEGGRAPRGDIGAPVIVER